MILNFELYHSWERGRCGVFGGRLFFEYVIELGSGCWHHLSSFPLQLPIKSEIFCCPMIRYCHLFYSTCFLLVCLVERLVETLYYLECFLIYIVM